MSTVNQLEVKYQKLFGRYSGYLPEDRTAIDDWHLDMREAIQSKLAKEGRGGFAPAVTALQRLIEANGVVRMYVQQMISGSVIEFPQQPKAVTTIDELLEALNQIVRMAPLYNPDPKRRNFFPMSSLFVYMMMTPAGEAAFRNTEFNNALRGVLQEWCRFLDSPHSLYALNEGTFGWLSPSAYAYNKLGEFVIPDRSAPHWGWSSFNAYFHREIKPECRPVAAPHDPKVIVSANDGTVYRIARGVNRCDEFWLKGQPYSLVNMLNNSPYVDRFVGGDVFQSFLSGADYHRWRSPIDGTVRHTEVVSALMFSDAESAGFDPTAGTYSQGYEASVNTRGLVYIESPNPTIGLVCVMPIGITEISSVTIAVKPGQKVCKGEELGWFSYGGSSMCLVFQPGAIDRFTVPEPSGANPDDGPAIKVNGQIAVAR